MTVCIALLGATRLNFCFLGSSSCCLLLACRAWSVRNATHFRSTQLKSDWTELKPDTEGMPAGS